MSSQPEKEWLDLISTPESQWSLLDAALHISLLNEPSMDVAAYRKQVSTMIDDLSSVIRDDETVNQKLKLINSFFFAKWGFIGSKQDYNNPENSLINRVLERRKGIPITLSLLYIELAHSVGLDIFGISFPGRFLVGVRDGDEQLIVDPFNQGQILSEQDISKLYTEMTHKHLAHTELLGLIKPATKRSILVRLLRNLKNNYIEAKKVEEALTVIQMILSLVPDASDEIRDRGMIYHHIDYSVGAYKDLTRYLEVEPDSQEKEIIQAVIDSLDMDDSILH